MNYMKMKSFSIIVILSSIVSALYSVEGEQYVAKSSIRRIFDDQTYGISMTLGMGVLHQCTKLNLSEIILNNIDAEALKFDTCYRNGIEEIITKYEPTTTQFNKSTIETSDAYPLFMCEFYTRTHACAKDFVPNILHCIVSDSNSFNLMYQAAKYGINLLCDNNAEILGILTKDRKQSRYFVKMTQTKLEIMFYLNEEIFFSTEPSCLQLLDVSVSIQEFAQWIFTSEAAKVFNRAALKLWDDSGCNSIVNVTEIFNNRL